MNSLTPDKKERNHKVDDFELLSDLEQVIAEEMQSLSRLEDDIEKRKKRLRKLRDLLLQETTIIFPPTNDEDIEAAKHWINIADVFLNTPTEYMETITADVFLDLLNEKDEEPMKSKSDFHFSPDAIKTKSS